MPIERFFSKGELQMSNSLENKSYQFFKLASKFEIFIIVSLATDTGERKEIIKCTGNSKSSSTLESFFLCTDLSTGHT